MMNTIPRMAIPLLIVAVFPTYAQTVPGVKAGTTERFTMDEALRRQAVLIEWGIPEEQNVFRVVGKALRSRGAAPLIFTIPPATVIVGSESGARFITLYEETIDLSKETSATFSIDAASASRRPRILASGRDRFAVGTAPVQGALRKVLPLLDYANTRRWSTAQALVWILADDAKDTDLYAMHGGSYGTYHDDDIIESMMLIERAGLGLSGRAIAPGGVLACGSWGVRKDVSGWCMQFITRQIDEARKAGRSAEVRAGWSALALMAARDGDHVELAGALASGADIEGRTRTRLTPLMVAAEQGHIEAVKLLLSRGANMDARDEAGRPVLFRANHHPPVMALLVARGADVNARDVFENTALIDLAEFGSADAAKLLIESGADPNAKNMNGWTALMQACQEGNTSVVNVLLEARADVNAKDGTGRTPLSRTSDLGIRTMLKKMGARE